MPHQRLQVAIPWSALGTHPRIFPFFLPFRGCVTRCLFCAQDIVTGQNTNHAPLKPLLDQLFTSLKLAANSHPLELAFYGGTFTALDEAEFALCLEFVQAAYAQNLLTSVRCSTRPDTLTPKRLCALRKAHFTTIELGIQSFHQESLAICRRSYDQDLAYQACQLVREFGFKLGLQLLPGMPKNTPELFLADVQKAIQCQADFLRFYPCLVLANTGLAKLWAMGAFKPWELDLTIETLALALNLANAAQVPVIRMGLPQEMDQSKILAGPVCFDLGSRVQAKALFLTISDLLGKYSKLRPDFDLTGLFLPKSLQGFFWGHKKELSQAYANLGLTKDKIFFGEYAAPYLEFVQEGVRDLDGLGLE